MKGRENDQGFDDIFIFISTDAKDEVEKYCENNLPGSVLILEISKIIRVINKTILFQILYSIFLKIVARWSKSEISENPHVWKKSLISL